MKYLLFAVIVIACSCNWAKKKTKETVNKTGEVVAKASSEFVDGVSKGIERSFQNEVVVSDQLKDLGIKPGKIIIHGTDSTTDNILSVYLIFEKDFDRSLTIKVMNPAGQEYGRKTEHIKGKKDEAGYFDFVFDRRTNIDGKGKLQFD